MEGEGPSGQLAVARDKGHSGRPAVADSKGFEAATGRTTTMSSGAATREAVVQDNKALLFQEVWDVWTALEA